jgi:arylsulfatase A-like enzyme/Tfp pilus assembly protein PilF
MPFKKLIISIFALAIIIPQNILCQKLKSDDNRPNILIVTIDTLRADRVRCYGYEKINTAVMDQLSHEGVLFEDVSCAVPLTLPSHASIFTALYPFSHGMRHNQSFIKTWNKPTLAEILRQQGYKTAAFLASSILDSQFGLDHGFEFYDDAFAISLGQIREAFAEKSASTVAKSALDWLQQNKEGKFFLWIHFFDPHDPYVPPEPFKSQYPENPYDGEVAYTDSVLGEVFAKLKEWQLYRNTLIIVTSDHGEGLGDHKEVGHGYFIYESTLRVPLIFFWQGKIPSNKRIKVPVRLIDIMPTVLDLLDIPLKVAIDGKSFKSLILGKERNKYNPRGESSYFESYYARLILNWSELRGLREGNWKYIDAPKPELYNLASDPEELKNLYQTNKHIAQNLKAKLEHIAGGEKAALAKPEQTPDPKLLAKLESLGYLGSVHPKASESGAGNRPDPKDKIDLWNEIFNSIELRRMRRYPEAIKSFQQLLREEPENFMIMENLGKCYYLATEYDKALKLYQDVSIIRLKQYGEENTDNALTYNNIGVIYNIKGVYSKALEFHQKALKIRLNLLGEEHPDTATSYNNIGLAYKSVGEYDKALRFYQRALQIELKIYGDEHPSIATCYGNIGEIYTKKGEYNEALELQQKALQILLNVYGEKHHYTATAYNNIGGVYSSTGNSEKALQFFQKALDIRLKFYGEDHPDTATSYNNIGEIYYRKGEYDKCLHFHQKALKILLNVYGEQHPNTATTYNNLGLVYQKKAEYNKALEFFQKDLKICSKLFGEEHPSTATSYNNISFVYISMGNYQKALTYAEKAFGIYEKFLGSSHPYTQDTAAVIKFIKERMPE